MPKRIASPRRRKSITADTKQQTMLTKQPIIKIAVGDAKYLPTAAIASNSTEGVNARINASVGEGFRLADTVSGVGAGVSSFINFQAVLQSLNPE